MPELPTFPEFIQLLDNDIVSLTLIVHPDLRRDHCAYVSITQLNLSLYLMTQRQWPLDWY